MKQCVIIAGGDVREEIAVPEGALLLCADCGYRHALRQGLVPDVLMGDFDSFTEPLPATCRVLRHPAEKDETDTMLAVYYGRDCGYREFHIYGALGGTRFDHTMANIQMLHHMAEQGLCGILHDGNTTISVQLPGTVAYPAFEGYLSIFALTETCGGVTLRGVKYPLENGTLHSSYPLGVSNEITAGQAEITLQSGVLLVIRTMDAPNS